MMTCFTTRMMSGSKIYRHPLPPPPHVAGNYRAHCLQFTNLIIPHNLIPTVDFRAAIGHVQTICAKLYKYAQKSYRECFSPFIYGPAVWVMGYSGWALKPQPSHSADVAATLLMQTTWQAYGCMWKLQQCVFRTLEVFCECGTVWKAVVIFTKAHSFHQYGLWPDLCFWCSAFSFLS